MEGPESIGLDTSSIFKVSSYLEFRSDNVILEISGPSHAYEPDNIIAMGQIGVDQFGSSYQTVPNIQQHYLCHRNESQSRLSFNKAILNMGLITNVGEKLGRPSSDPGNKLTFKFSVYAMNYDENVGKTVPLHVQLIIGEKTVWSKSVAIKINERRNERSSARMLSSVADFDPLNGTQGSITTLSLLTEFSESNSFTEYSVVVEVPTARKLALLEPCSARLVKEKTGINIPYIDSKQIEPIIDGNQFTFHFGRIQIVRQRSPSKKYENTLAAEIVLKIAFHEENIEGYFKFI